MDTLAMKHRNCDILHLFDRTFAFSILITSQLPLGVKDMSSDCLFFIFISFCLSRAFNFFFSVILLGRRCTIPKSAHQMDCLFSFYFEIHSFNEHIKRKMIYRFIILKTCLAEFQIKRKDYCTMCSVSLSEFIFFRK